MRTETTAVAGLGMRELNGGSGDPLVKLHHSFGNPGWMPVHEALADHYSVHALDLPGYGGSEGSERPDWARHPRDLALLVGQWLRAKDFGPVELVGCGFGGWVAAELATMAPELLQRLVLVGAAGLLPEKGRIYDQFLVSHSNYVQAAFSQPEAYEAIFHSNGDSPDELPMSDDTLTVWDMNREMKTMTDDGPFSWEGEHFQYRVVNPWARVLQKPHPRIWVPGVFSAETIRWAAEHRYPYISLNTPLHLTGELWQIYDQAARAVGYEAGPENRGYLLRVHVQKDGDKARENAREFMWMQGEFTGIGHPYWVSPSGYGSSARRLDYAKMANAEVRGSRAASFEKQLAAREIVAGTPDEVIAELRVVLETCRPSILMLWGNDGGVNHDDSRRCIELMGTEVLPALRDMGDELGLHDPFELDSPISLALTPPDELNPIDSPADERPEDTSDSTALKMFR